jgi:hypothetical protein
MPLMTVRAYARHRGITHPAVLRAIEDGRIRKRPDGKIDSAEADRLWEQRTDPSKPLNSVTGNPKHRRPAGGPSLPMGSRGDPGGTGGSPNERFTSSYAAASAIEKTYKAKREKIAYERDIGKLVDADEVRAATFKAGRAARDRMLGIPARLAAVLAAVSEPAEVQRLLEEAIVQACAELAAGPAAPRKAS